MRVKEVREMLANPCGQDISVEDMLIVPEHDFSLDWPMTATSWGAPGEYAAAVQRMDEQLFRGMSVPRRFLT